MLIQYDYVSEFSTKSKVSGLGLVHPLGEEKAANPRARLGAAVRKGSSFCFLTVTLVVKLMGSVPEPVRADPASIGRKSPKQQNHFVPAQGGTRHLKGQAFRTLLRFGGGFGTNVISALHTEWLFDGVA